jgi:hypothetical protein
MTPGLPDGFAHFGQILEGLRWERKIWQPWMKRGKKNSAAQISVTVERVQINP